MNETLRDLDVRLERLERENKRLKRWSGALCGGFALLGLLGMAAPTLCDVVSGERLVLRDETGRQRIVLDAYRNDLPTLTLQTRAGQPLATLGIDKQGEAYFRLFDAAGKEKTAYTTGGCTSGGGGAPAPETPAPKPDCGKPTVVGG